MLTFYKQTHTNTRTQAHAFSLQPFNRLLISIWYCVLAVTSKSSCIRFCWAVFNRQTYWKTLCLFNHGHTHTHNQNPSVYCVVAVVGRNRSLPSNVCICQSKLLLLLLLRTQDKTKQNMMMERREWSLKYCRNSTHAFVLIYGLPVFFFCNCTSRMHTRIHIQAGDHKWNGWRLSAVLL